ncbi:MAG: phosphoglycerate kinase [Bdellovibrionales bacterium]
MTTYKTLNDLPNIQGKTILLRADLNVPTNENKQITDTTRIDRLKATIDDLVSRGATIKILSHFGRPKGQENADFSLEFLAPELSKAWGHPVAFKQGASNIILLENTRFSPEEEQNAPSLAQQWAQGADIYINDAFSVSHRAHASTEAIAQLLPTYAGHLMTQELQALEKALEAPQKPVTALVGGAKISTKLDLLNNLIKKVDFLILGGGMANTFVCAQGFNVGASLCENDMLETARQIMDNAKEENCEIILPTDFVVAQEFKAHAPSETVSTNNIPSDKMALDIGAESIQTIKKVIDQSKTIVWNGPMGAFEIEPFDKATVALAQYVAEKTQNGALISVAGGGDTVSALAHAGVKDKLTYLSSAGGAFLEWLEGKELPGVKALSR